MCEFNDIRVGDYVYHIPDGADNSTIIGKVIQRRNNHGSDNLVIKILDKEHGEDGAYIDKHSVDECMNYDHMSNFGQHCVYGSTIEELLIELI